MMSPILTCVDLKIVMMDICLQSFQWTLLNAHRVYELLIFIVTDGRLQNQTVFLWCVTNQCVTWVFHCAILVPTSLPLPPPSLPSPRRALTSVLRLLTNVIHMLEFRHDVFRVLCFQTLSSRNVTITERLRCFGKYTHVAFLGFCLEEWAGSGRYCT